MKLFFSILLAVSIAFPIFSFFTTSRDIAHNQYKMRQERLQGTTQMATGSAHLGLTAGQLAGLSELVSSAYKDSVYDGYRLGEGYFNLWCMSLALDFLLFISSLAGLFICRKSERPSKPLGTNANA